MNLRFLGVKEWLRRGWGDRSPAQHLWNSVLVGFGYLLSPLSWWNDLVFNLPIAYGFARLVTWGHRDWLGPAVLLGYWLSNVLGLVMMQWGVVDWARSPQNSPSPKATADTLDSATTTSSSGPAALPPATRKLSHRDWIWSLGSATVYSVAIAALVLGHWLKLPEGLLP